MLKSKSISRSRWRSSSDGVDVHGAVSESSWSGSAPTSPRPHLDSGGDRGLGFGPVRSSAPNLPLFDGAVEHRHDEEGHQFDQHPAN